MKEKEAEKKNSSINSKVKKSANGVATQKSTKANSKSSGKAKSEQTSAKAKKQASVKEPVSEPKPEEKVLDTQAKVEQDTKTKDELTLASQEEKIKKNAGKSSTRKKAAVATAVVLLLIAGVSVPTAVYLSKRKVSVDIENNVDVIQEYTVNVKRGTTIKDIVPQDIKGYTFVGFYKDENLTQPYDEDEKINKNTTIYAKYEANTYKLTLPTSPSFTIEGEGIENNQVEVEHNSEYSFKLNLSTGYEESEITVKVNGEVITPDSDGYYTITITGDMTVEVEGVQINTYSVTFYDNIDKETVLHIDEVQYNQYASYDNDNAPTKPADKIYRYEFNGWVDESGKAVNLESTRIVSNLDLYASFKSVYIEYTISNIPEQVSIKKNNEYLTSTSTLHYGDIIEITYETTEGYNTTEFSVSGAEKMAGQENQYKVTGNLEITYSEQIKTFTVEIQSSNPEYGTVNETSLTVDYGTEIIVSGNQITIGDTTIRPKQALQ